MSGHYGVMTHFLPCVDTIDQFNTVVNAFNVDAYANDIAKTGASYVIFTIGQDKYFCSPNSVLNGQCGPVTSRRDLVSEVAAALSKRHIRIIAYIPSGAPDVMAEGTRYKEVDDGGRGRRAAFQQIWNRAISEYSSRWGRSISGWWIDGMYEWEKMYAFQDGPSYRTLAQACRAGNPDSVVSFNDGGGPFSNHSEYGDSAAGDIHRHEQSLPECLSRWAAGVDPATGHAFQVQWNVHTFLGHEFLGNGFGGPNDTPRFTDSYIAGYVSRVTSRGGTCQLDAPIHMGGCNDPAPDQEGHLGKAFLRQLKSIARSAAKHSTDAPLENIALSKAAATNLPDTAPTGNGNDGDKRTDFTSAENDADVPYWQVDLGSTMTITGVELVLSQRDEGKVFRNEIQILGSNTPDFAHPDILAWMMEGFELPEHGTFRAFLTTPRAYRYVRVSRPPKDYHVYWWKPALKFAEVRVLTRASDR